MYKLIVKSENNWKAHKSGDLNKLNTNFLFDTPNGYGFPIVQTSEAFEAKDGLIAFNLCKKRKAENMFKAVHFFLDDYKFEQIWTSPHNYITLFQDYGNIISPTFSVWSNQPYALNLFNVYRSRWITRYYQMYNVNVLVDVRWSDERSYEYAFSGIKKNTPVIVNTVGTYKRDNRELFINGFYEMIRRLEPNKLFVYGEYFPVNFEEYFDSVTYFDSFWKERRKCYKERRNEMIGREPQCLTCRYFKGHPAKYGDKAKCSLKKFCPEKVYWEGARCALYKGRLNNGSGEKQSK